MQVHIITFQPHRGYSLEGTARLVRWLNREANRALVDFGDGYGALERFVDPAAQTNPEAYLTTLNADWHRP